MPFTINGTTGINLGTQPLTGSLPDANAPSGSVIQAVSATYSTSGSTTSTSYTSTGFTASITPTSSSSKILVLVSCPIYTSTPASYSVRFNVFRGTTSGTSLGDSNLGFGPFGSYTGVNTGVYVWSYLSVNYLDSPSTTSEQVYTLAAKSEGNSAPAQWCTSGSKAVITLMEIAA
jgi:hypothetical protein